MTIAKAIRKVRFMLFDSFHDIFIVVLTSPTKWS
jgi:hypothetical protein